MTERARALRWLLVGAGDIARKRVASALSQVEGSVLEAVCAPRVEAAQALARTHGVSNVYTQLDQALDCSGVDAVYLATPVHLHVRQALAALEAGKHVLVEKPLALTEAECAPLLAAVEQTGLVAGCAYYRRLSARYVHARQVLADGGLGRLLAVHLAYYGWFAPALDDPKHWRVVHERSGGGPLSDIGSHMLDLLIGLCGLPVSIYARCDNRVHAWDVEDTASVLMVLPGGAQVTATFSWAARTWQHTFELAGSEGRLLWQPYDTGPVSLTVAGGAETLDLPPADNVHLPLVEDFVQAVRERRPPACPVSEAALTNRLLDAIYRSSAEDRPIAVAA